ncbi:MAG: alanine racemase [Candidatus Omnitrophota bacterium]
MDKTKSEKTIPLTWAEVDLGAIRHNFRAIKKMVRSPGRCGVQLLAVVKADAYGHGMPAVAALLEKEGVDLFGVSDVKEGIALRKKGTRKPILLFESTLPDLAEQIVRFQLIPTVSNRDIALALNRFAKSKGKKVPVHVKVDTGMGRLGVGHEQAVEFIEDLRSLPYISVEGIYTHFPSADSDRKFTQGQIRKMQDIVQQLSKKGCRLAYVHAANSMGLSCYPTPQFNLARLGLMLYGLYPSALVRRKIQLRPALTVKSRIIFLKKIARGRSISYGRTFIARREMTVATLPIGYSDGYLRCFSNRAFVLVQGKRCPVLGRVTMDQIVIDVTKVKPVKLGMTVTVLGGEKGKSVSADDLAAWAQTINYEIVCCLGSRLPRRYKS